MNGVKTQRRPISSSQWSHLARSLLQPAAVLVLMAALGGCADDANPRSSQTGSSAAQSSVGPQTTDTSSPGSGGRAEDRREPTVTGPVSGGKGEPTLLSVPIDAASAGYAVEEYFLEGDAVAYAADELSTDGRWNVREASTAAYKTRIVVWRPEDPAEFNGTVYVEWFNVTAGFDAPFEWITAHNEIIREDAAWVGVSAQSVGVEGGAGVVAVPGMPTAGGLKDVDPERYESLAHPGDGYSYDIFTQAGLATLGEGKGVHPFDGYDTARLIGMGESQSAMRLTTYANAVQPSAHVYDGLLIHSRAGDAASLAVAGQSQGDPSVPSGVAIRDDLDIPVVVLETETDLLELGFAAARQPDSATFRLWEMAGTSHIDGFPSFFDTGDGEAELAVLDPTRASPGPLSCPANVNAGVQQPIVQAAVAGLERWVRDGVAPPEAPRIETSGSGADVTIVRDDYGIAVGGVRTPLVDVPLAANTGESGTAEDLTGPGGVCRLYGTSTALSASELSSRYPDGSEDYTRQFDEAADEAVDQGFWLSPEAEHYKAAARQVTVG